MIRWSKRHSVSIINRKWEVLKPIVKVKHVPRHGELIFFEDDNEYFRVVNVVHYLNKKHGIFIIVEELSGRPTD